MAGIAVAVRLVTMTSLHPLSWDEVEFFRATDWVRQGLVPFRDFWEHHTPLQWFVFAPFAAMTRSTGAAAVIFMRWAQVPLWIVTFWIANRWMRAAGLSRFARWTAVVLAVCSSLLMLPAMEYRVDVLGCALYLAGLLLLLERRPTAAADDARGRASLHFAAGVVFCLAGFANLRLGPLLALTALLALVIDTRERKWRFVPSALRMYGGVAVTLVGGFLYFAATHSLTQLHRYVWVENYLADEYNTPVPWAFAHRMLVPFGIRIWGGAGHWFQLSGIDLAGAAILLLGFVGIVRACARWRRPDELFMLAILQLASILFIAKMVFVYHYHFEIVTMMLLPFVAGEVERWGREQLVIAFLVLTSILNAAFALLRGKENDLAYQDVIMREVHARTAPDARVFDGVGWATRRKPAYRFWFLPELARELVRHGHAAPYTVAEWIADPPAAVITDRNAAVWLARNPELGGHVVRHYLPIWRNLWVPGMSGVVQPRQIAEWVVPADGTYRLFASARLANDPWFVRPLAYGVVRPPIRFAAPALDVPVALWRNGEPVRAVLISLRRGDRVRLASPSAVPIGVFLVAGTEQVWFRQPPAGVTLDSEAGRVTHVPRLYNPFSAQTPTWSR